jgi:pyruvate formate lyase activating enzyme
MFLASRCMQCDACLAACPQGAITRSSDTVSTNFERCTLCGTCVEACYAQAREMVGREMTVAEAMAEIERDIPFYDESGGGATFSGGEPLLQPAFLLELLRACKAQEIRTAVDTCGYASWEAFDDIRAYVDLFLYDLKLIDAERHKQFTGVSNAPILENVEKLSQLGHVIILRVPVIPGINDDDESIHQMGAFAAELPHLDRLDVLPYHSLGSEKYGRLNKEYGLPETRPPTGERVAEIVRMLEASGLDVRVGG